jgi:general L-amino acid transport system substrate-binding protein
LINAEEVGLTKEAAASDRPLEGEAARLVDGAGKNGEPIGLSRTWLRDVVKAVGNYGEMFEADLGKGSPLGMERGINALWKRGGVLYAPPMW